MQTAPRHSQEVIDVIIPAFNEEEAISKVIAEIPSDMVREIIVCDNGSTDRTAFNASKAGATVISQPLRGYGNACLAGLQYISEKPGSAPPAILVFLDGDHSDYPEEMPALLAPILEDKADLVIGTRVRALRENGSMTFPQRFGNALATACIRLLFRYTFTDLGPFRAIRWSSLQALDMQDRNYGWTVEMQVKAAKHKLQCAEVPVRYRKRIGKSKVSGTVKGTLLAGHKILTTIFKEFLKQ